MAERCDACRFWRLGEPWGGRPPQHADWHEDDLLGTCHRYAPRPTMGDFEYRMMQALVLIAPDDDDLNTSWEECVNTVDCAWPTTSGSSWCGEFQGTE